MPEKPKHSDYAYDKNGDIVGSWLICSECNRTKFLYINQKLEEVAWIDDKCLSCWYDILDTDCRAAKFKQCMMLAAKDNGFRLQNIPEFIFSEAMKLYFE